MSETTKDDAFEAGQADDSPIQVVTVRGTPWVFQQVTGTELKRMEAKCRNPRTNRLDSARYLELLCVTIVLGKAELDKDGVPTTTAIKGTRFDPSKELAPACNAMEEALTSFLGY
jgi:hypothetical protein